MNFINRKNIKILKSYPKDDSDSRGDEAFFNLAEKIYDPSKHSDIDMDRKIENNIHFIWLTQKIPEQYIFHVKIFAELNVDLDIILWVDDCNKSLKIPNVNVTHYKTIKAFTNEGFFDKSTRGAKKADILRYFVILKYGGLYLDIDCQPLKSLNDVISKSFIMYNNSSRYLHSNAYFAFYKGHSILKFVNDMLPLCYEHYDNILDQCGPTFFSRCIYFLNPDIYSLFILDAHETYWAHLLHGSWTGKP